jgi:hypothetical protein
MAKSRSDPERKQKLETFKKQQKLKNKNKFYIMNENQENMNQGQTEQQLPPVREIPHWSSKEMLLLQGAEYEIIYNAIAQAQQAINAAFGVASAIMQNNVADGKIKMGFQKLNAEGTDYEDMTAEEQKPHIENFEKLLDEFRNAKARMAEEKAKPAADNAVEGLIEPVTTQFVDASGAPISSQN